MQESILLLGPTGAGKSPLGDYLAQNGFNGAPCFHFDFGDQLRRVAYGKLPGWKMEDVSLVTRILEKGRLLERSEFSLAVRILGAFTSMHGKGILILNGLPRHLQQAEDLSPHIQVNRVILLSCTPTVAMERIRLNSGGDRVERRDDVEEKIRERLRLFEARTQPIVDYYRQKQVQITRVRVDVNTQACDVARHVSGDQQYNTSES